MDWSLLFGYLLLDDSFRIHERMGAQYFNLSPTVSLRAKDFGKAIGLSIIIPVEHAPT